MSAASDGPLSSTPNEPASDRANGPTSSLPEPATVHEVFADHELPPDEPTVTDKVKTLLVGQPFDLADKRVYHHISLVAFLAWVGLGADGLSSSAYGPEEAFRQLGQHTHLAVFAAERARRTGSVVNLV